MGGRNRSLLVPLYVGHLSVKLEVYAVGARGVSAHLRGTGYIFKA